MEHSRVYLHIRFLVNLREAPVSERKVMLGNITTHQLRSIIEIATRILNGVVSPLRRDAQTFRHRRMFLRTLTSRTVSFTRKKALLKRRFSLVPIMLRTIYLIPVIVDEIQTAREQ